MELKEKDSSTLQAQAEYFADAGLPEFSDDQKLFFKYSDQLSRIGSLNKVPEDFPQELKDLIALKKDAYVIFLRKSKKKERDFFEQNIRFYNEHFKTEVDLLKQKISSTENPRELDQFLGSGSRGDAYRLVIDGEDFVVKFSSSLTQNNYEIKPFLRSQNIPHTPRLIAFSLADGVKIMSMLPGQNVTSFSPEDKPDYPDRHFIQLIETVLELERNGIVIDPKASNFLYSSEEGFSILDFQLSNGKRFTEPQHQVMSLVVALTAAKFPEQDWNDEDALREQKIQYGKIFFPTLIKFLSIMQTNYPELLKKWREQLDEERADPRVRIPDLVDRGYWSTDDHEIENYLAKLESMGF